MAFKYGDIAVQAAKMTQQRRAQQQQTQMLMLQQFAEGLQAIQAKRDQQAKEEDIMSLIEGYDPKKGTFSYQPKTPGAARLMLDLQREDMSHKLETRKLKLEKEKADAIAGHYKSQDELDRTRMDILTRKEEEEKAKKAREVADLLNTDREMTGPTTSTQEPGPLDAPDLVSGPTTEAGLKRRDQINLKREEQRRYEYEKGLEERKIKFDEKLKTDMEERRRKAQEFREKEAQAIRDTQERRMSAIQEGIKQDNIELFTNLKARRLTQLEEGDADLRGLRRQAMMSASDPGQLDALNKLIEQRTRELEIEAATYARTSIEQGGGSALKGTGTTPSGGGTDADVRRRLEEQRELMRQRMANRNRD